MGIHRRRLSASEASDKGSNPLAVTYDDGPPLEFEGLDAQAQTFHTCTCATAQVQVSDAGRCYRSTLPSIDAGEAQISPLVKTVGSLLGSIARRASTGPRSWWRTSR